MRTVGHDDPDASALHGGGPLRRLWRGDVALARSFWGLGVGGGLLAVLFALHVVGPTQSILFGLAGLLLLWGWQVLALVAVWRSAGRYRGPRHWPLLARLAMLAALLLHLQATSGAIF